MQEDIFEPLKTYKTKFKDEFNDKASQYFDSLVFEYNIDQELNKKKYKELLDMRNDLANYTKKRKVYSVFFSIFLTIAMISLIYFAYTIYCFFSNINNLNILLIEFFSSLLISFTSFLLTFLVFNKNKNKYSNLISNLEPIANERTNDIRTDLAKLYSTLNNEGLLNIYNLIEDTTKIIKFDQEVDLEKILYLKQECNLDELNSNESCLFLKTGSLFGNPFVLFSVKAIEICKETYTGSRTVSYRVGDRNYSKTLTASLSVDVPKFFTKNFLVFSSDAASNLTFNRYPSGIKYPTNENGFKSYYKQIDSIYSKIIKMHEKNPSSFTPLSDKEFEVLYNAKDRSNDVDFRVLFTPLAISNFKSDLKYTDDPYVDDFNFVKSNKLNFSSSNHSQFFSFIRPKDGFYNLSLENLKNNYITYANEFFKHFYYDFLPILNIPVYQQHKHISYIYGKDYNNLFSTYEYEYIANNLNINNFKDKRSKTDVLLKLNKINVSDGFEQVLINTKTYDMKMRVTNVTVNYSGGSAEVPVSWPEYIELNNTIPYNINKLKGVSLEDKNNFFYKSKKIEF